MGQFNLKSFPFVGFSVERNFNGIFLLDENEDRENYIDYSAKPCMLTEFEIYFVDVQFMNTKPLQSIELLIQEMKNNTSFSSIDESNEFITSSLKYST